MAMLSARRAVPARVMMSSRSRGTRMTLGPPPTPVLGLLALSTAPGAGGNLTLRGGRRRRAGCGVGRGGSGGAGKLGKEEEILNADANERR